jgi:putative tricarboxylic transport membrane protein
LIAPVALLALAAAVIWSSLGLGYWTSLGPGPGFFPLWLAVLLAALSGIWLVEQVRGAEESVAAAAESAAGADIPEAPETPLPTGELITIVISLVVLAVLLEVLGFQLSMLLFLLFQLKVLGRRRWPLTIVLSLLGSFGIYTLFAQVLSVNLPVSAIPFLQSLGL